MSPAFRSTRSVIAFATAIAVLLCLPFLLLMAGLPSREQVWSAMPTKAGDVGDVVRALYHDKADGDIVVVGSSLVRRGIDFTNLQRSLSRQLGRPVTVESLALNWPGVDVQYAMLRDYLDRHQAKIVLWNAPPVATPWNEAHTQAYRWYRFGDYTDVVGGLSFASRLQLYAEAVFGAPKQVLLKLRSNLLGETELNDRVGEDANKGLASGYRGAAFVAEAVPAAAPAALLTNADDSPVVIEGKRPSAYEIHFSRALVFLALAHHCRIYLLHIPTDEEFGKSTVPEAVNWSSVTGIQMQELAVPATTLFGNINYQRFVRSFSDHHLNINGRALFTSSLLPELSRLLDQSISTRPDPWVKNGG